jgi:putative membrane protein
MKLLLHWILSALAMLLVAHFVPGFVVKGFVAALIAAAVYGLVNATLGTVLKVLTFPLAILTLGLFLLIINALMLQFAAWLLPGIEVHGFWPAFWAALLLAILGMVIHAILPGDRRAREARR